MSQEIRPTNILSAGVAAASVLAWSEAFSFPVRERHERPAKRQPVERHIAQAKAKKRKARKAAKQARRRSHD